MKTRKLHIGLLFLFVVIAIASVIKPYDVQLWIMEAIVSLVGVGLLVLTYNRFRFTDMCYLLVFIHTVIMLVGAHYSYAEVPLFDTISKYFGWERNNYDKLGHFAQGFVPAAIAR